MESKKVQKTKRAKVASRSGDKSVRVMIEYKVKHLLYGKYINRRTKLGVHDPENAANVGDTVEIMECRPISKTINWRLIQVLEVAVIQ